MKKETKLQVYVIGRATHYSRFLSNHELVDQIEDADVVILTGGEDVDPSLYGAAKHPSTYSSLYRDKAEMAEIDQVRPDQLVVGICRGSQLSCVINGGLLVQNCDKHGIGGCHGIAPSEAALQFDSVEDQEYQITSTHHQMQYPYNLDPKVYDVLFTASPRRSSFYQGDKIHEDVIKMLGECEVVLYHHPGRPKFLAIQGHPEMIPDRPVSSMLEDLIYEIVTELK